jgi:AraC family transcriptional regulator
MDWVDRMNEAIGYIEDHILGDIDFTEAARRAGCSKHHFLRMFPYVADVPLSEYVRRRRLTLAAFELQNSQAKVIDIALKYGYESPEAFARAFQMVHGTTPTAARGIGARLKSYSRISFQISIKGAMEMNYRMEQLGEFSIVGVQERVNTSEVFSVVPQLWSSAAQDGLFQRLWEVRASGHPVRGILGVCADGDHGRKDELLYIMSIVSEQLPPEGMVRRSFHEASWAVFEAEGGPEAIGQLWKRLYTEWLPTSGYELANLPAIECYLPPEENKNELWIAVVKK